MINSILLIVLVLVVWWSHHRIDLLTKRKIYGVTDRGDRVVCRMMNGEWTLVELDKVKEIFEEKHIDIEI